MWPEDVLRGMKWAYLGGVAFTLVTYAGSVEVNAIVVVGIILGGAALVIPSLLIAFLLHFVFAALGARIGFWAAPFLSACVMLAYMWGLAMPHGLSDGMAGYAITLGIVAGLGFWYGAVGWKQSAEIRRD